MQEACLQDSARVSGSFCLRAYVTVGGLLVCPVSDLAKHDSEETDRLDSLSETHLSYQKGRVKRSIAWQSKHLICENSPLSAVIC